MELRSRSRSKTPFTTEMEQNFITTRSRKSTKITSASTTTKTKKSTVGKLIKTSDYSSEEGEDVQHITENDKNQIIEDAKKAANGSNEVSALSLYRKAGRYWDKYPKTDWTYSPHSRDRVEIAPGVVAMPNMSRRTIHSTGLYSDKFVSTEDKEEESHYIENNYNNYEIRRQKLFSNNNELDESDGYHYITTKRTTITKKQSIFIKILTIITGFFYYFYEKQQSTVLWIGKKIHRFASRIMLLDTWLLRKRNTEKNLKKIIYLCLLPLVLFGGVHVLLANGVPLAPSCHPHCGRIVSSYLNSFTNKINGFF